MASRTVVYNSDEVLIVMGPVTVQGGRGDDEFCRIEPESNIAEDVVGVDGEVVVSRTNDGRHTVTLTVLQTSKANNGLSILANLFKTAPGAAGGIVPFLVKDLNGLALYTAENAWIQKEPDVTYARAAGTREWEIRAAQLIRVDGGS